MHVSSFVFLQCRSCHLLSCIFQHSEISDFLGCLEESIAEDMVWDWAANTNNRGKLDERVKVTKASLNEYQKRFLRTKMKRKFNFLKKNIQLPAGVRERQPLGGA